MSIPDNIYLSFPTSKQFSRSSRSEFLQASFFKTASISEQKDVLDAAGFRSGSLGSSYNLVDMERILKLSLLSESLACLAELECSKLFLTVGINF